MTDRAVNHNWNRPQETTVTDTQPDLTQALAVTKPGNGVARANPKAAIKAEVERYRGAIAKTSQAATKAAQTGSSDPCSTPS